MPRITESIISDFPGEKPVSAWTLTGRDGLSITILTFGGIVQSIVVPNKDGDFADIVLGFKNPSDYLGSHPYFGATAGRIAGRVKATRSPLMILHIISMGGSAQSINESGKPLSSPAKMVRHP
jgi:hypothetical protein